MNDFTKGNIGKELLLFAFPMLIGSALQQMYSMVDMIIVGRFVSGEALAAVGISTSIVMFVLSSLIGLTTGASVVISQFFGAKQYEKLKTTVSVSITTMLGVSLLLSIVGIVLAPFFLNLLNTNEDILSDAVLYMRILMGGIVFPIFYNIYTAYMRALGDSRRPLYFLILSTILNIGFNLFFVLIMNMGVAGVAIGTILAQMIAALLCFLYASRRIPLLKVSKLQFNTEIFKLILKYGVPPAVQISFVSFAHLTITRLINSFGSLAMAGITAASRIDQFGMMPGMTLSMAVSTFVGQNMGAGLEDRARKTLRIGMLYMLLCSVLMTAILIVFRSTLMSLFLNQADPNTPEILRIGSEYLNIMVSFYFLFAILFAFNGFFRGAGDAIIAMVFPIISLSIRVSSAYGFVGFFGMGPEAVAWSIPIGWGLSSFASWIYYKKRLWAGKAAVVRSSP